MTTPNPEQNVEAIRQILFGQEQRALEQKIQALADGLAQANQQLAQTKSGLEQSNINHQALVQSSQASLDSFVQSTFQSLNNSHGGMTGEMQQLREQFNQTIDALKQQLAEQQGQISEQRTQLAEQRTQLVAQSQLLAKAIDSLNFLHHKEHSLKEVLINHFNHTQAPIAQDSASHAAPTPHTA
jgi:chromosome segregation ATPase